MAHRSVLTRIITKIIAYLSIKVWFNDNIVEYWFHQSSRTDNEVNDGNSVQTVYKIYARCYPRHTLHVGKREIEREREREREGERGRKTNKYDLSKCSHVCSRKRKSKYSL